MTITQPDRGRVPRPAALGEPGGGKVCGLGWGAAAPWGRASFPRNPARLKPEERDTFYERDAVGSDFIKDVFKQARFTAVYFLMM